MTEELTKKYLKKTFKFIYFLQGIPFIQAFLLNGSLAQGKIKKTSDIDILTITKDNRLYTARFFVLVFGTLSGQKRSKDEHRPHAGKFCFNYFVTEGFLKIPTGRGKAMDQYCADNYSASVLVWGYSGIYQKFLAKNQLLFSKANSTSKLEKELLPYYFPVSNNKVLQGIKKLIERLLASQFGNWLESLLMRVQITMIEKDKRTQRYPDQVVYNAEEARFHPPKNGNCKVL